MTGLTPDRFRFGASTLLNESHAIARTVDADTRVPITFHCHEPQAPPVSFSFRLQVLGINSLCHESQDFPCPHSRCAKAQPGTRVRAARRPARPVVPLKERRLNFGAKWEYAPAPEAFDYIPVASRHNSSSTANSCRRPSRSTSTRLTRPRRRN